MNGEVDQFGILDLATLAIDVALFALLLATRHIYMDDPGDQET
jgi:hypothetical protein